jgi:hypothetical protein
VLHNSVTRSWARRSEPILAVAYRHLTADPEQQIDERSNPARFDSFV